MHKKIRESISQYINDYSAKTEISTGWRQPIVKFAAADDEMFERLKEVVSPTHALPRDFLENAETVISYFLPFAKSIAASNIEGKYTSEAWAEAYIETNQLISKLNNFIKKKLEDYGYESAIIPATHNFKGEQLISDWSHRHVGYIAGLGKFGLNNMLITDKGCCGRIGSLITSLKIEPSKRSDSENCLYKSLGSCQKCVDRCVNNALKLDSFDRNKCYDMCMDNDELHNYESLTDVCGKCCVDLPCSLINPTNPNMS